MQGLIENSHPQIYVYCNEAKMNCDKFKEIQRKLNDYGQYYIAYEEGHFKDELKHDFTYVLIKNAENSIEKKIDIAKELYDALVVSTDLMFKMVQYLVDSGDCTFSVQVQNINELMDTLRKSQNVLPEEIYSIAFNYSKDVIEKGFNWVLGQFKNSNKTLLNSTELQSIHDTLIKNIVNLDDAQNRINDIRIMFSNYINNLQNKTSLDSKFGNSTDYSFFNELAKSLNDLYVNSTSVYCNFSQIDNSQISEMMNKSCEGDYKMQVQNFANSIHQLVSVLNKIVEDSNAFQVYKQQLQNIDSKVLYLYPDRKMLDMNNLIDVVAIFEIVQKTLQEPSMSRLITARLATNVGKGLEYNNAKVRSFFYTGNIICSEINPNYVNNIGAAILHDLYMIIPDDYKRLISSNLSQALSDAEEIGDLYHIPLGK